MKRIVRSVKRLTPSDSFHTFGIERRNPNPRVRSEGKVWAAQFTSTEIINKSVIKQATIDAIVWIIDFTDRLIFNKIDLNLITEICYEHYFRRLPPWAL